MRAFEQWVDTSVLVAKSPVIEDIASWLPDEIAHGAGDVNEEKGRFARQIASDLLSDLKALGGQTRAANGEKEAADESENGDDEGDVSGSLLDLLFDQGLLPSYAFPTDLCSFVIQEWGDKGRIREKRAASIGESAGTQRVRPRAVARSQQADISCGWSVR